MPPSLATSQYPGGPIGSMEITSVPWLDRKFASVTLKVTVYCPEIVGVPLRTPFGARCMPGGNAPPATAHPYGANPPPADSEASYGTPMVPTVRLVEVTSGGAERVAMMPPKFVPVPTASQLTGLAHMTPDREATPGGVLSLVHPAPPLVVAMMLLPPTAVQIVVVMQLTDARAVDPMGVPRSAQLEPPLVVPMRWGPVARHVVSLEHEMPVRVVDAMGGAWGTQMLPPSDVERTTAFGPPDETPTAVQ